MTVTRRRCAPFVEVIAYEKVGRKRGMLLNSFMLETASFSHKRSGEGKGDGQKSAANGPAMDEEERTYALLQNIFCRASGRTNWEHVEKLDFMGLEMYLDAE